MLVEGFSPCSIGSEEPPRKAINNEWCDLIFCLITIILENRLEVVET